MQEGIEIDTLKTKSQQMKGNGSKDKPGKIQTRSSHFHIMFKKTPVDMSLITFSPSVGTKVLLVCFS